MNHPGDLTGSSDLVPWLNAVKKASQANEIKPGVGYRVRRTPQGTILEIYSTAKATSGSGNWNYRGMYDPAGTYMTYDVVQYGSGSAAGMYLSLTDNPTTAPDTGIGWLQVSTASGNWI